MPDNDVAIASQETKFKDRQTYWKHQIQAWKDSGLSQRAYCQQNNLKEYRFSKWKNRLGKNKVSNRFVRVPFPTPVPVTVKRSVLQVYSPSGFRIDVNEDFDAGLLKRLLTVLAEVPHAL